MFRRQQKKKYEGETFCCSFTKCVSDEKGWGGLLYWNTFSYGKLRRPVLSDVSSLFVYTEVGLCTCCASVCRVSTTKTSSAEDKVWLKKKFLFKEKFVIPKNRSLLLRENRVGLNFDVYLRMTGSVHGPTLICYTRTTDNWKCRDGAQCSIQRRILVSHKHFLKVTS